MLMKWVSSQRKEKQRKTRIKNLKKNIEKTRRELIKAVEKSDHKKINELLFLYHRYLIEFENL